ncbi:MAG TPA: TIR domain-containing protein, partial [Fimbriimonadaceae bacterium]|nr:TIR domain-containing protein [Fimbriimonadaceae bacterium]
ETGGTAPALNQTQVALIRVFASFDIDRDKDLVPRLVDEGRTRGARFTVFDCSSHEAPSEEVLERLRARISHVDAVVVLCGEYTHRAPNVNAELRIAQEMGKRYYLIAGRRNIDCSRPAVSRMADKLYQWKNGTINELVIRFH